MRVSSIQEIIDYANDIAGGVMPPDHEAAAEALGYSYEVACEIGWVCHQACLKTGEVTAQAVAAMFGVH